MTFENKRLIGIVVAVAALLSIPFFAMKFTDEVKWDVRDFGIMGVLLLGTALSCEIVLRRVNSVWHRLAICAVILFALFVVWAELAVGLFGTPFACS